MASEEGLQGGQCKATAKVYIPVRNETGEDCRGRLLGVRGSMLKQLISESGCHMALRGRGSCHPPGTGSCMRCLENLHEPLHVLVVFTGPAEWRDTTISNAGALIRAVLQASSESDARAAGPSSGPEGETGAQAVSSALATDRPPSNVVDDSVLGILEDPRPVVPPRVLDSNLIDRDFIDRNLAIIRQNVALSATRERGKEEESKGGREKDREAGARRVGREGEAFSAERFKWARNGPKILSDGTCIRVTCILFSSRSELHRFLLLL